MARTRKLAPQVVPVENYLNGVAKNLVERIYGPAGPAWGTRLTEIEDTVMAIRQHLSEQMLQQALQRQADTVEQRPAEYRDCPSCGGSVEAKPAGSRAGPETGTAAEPPPDPRGLETGGGDVQWHEPECYCQRCRRSFSPSVPKPRP
jgi:hypothetical protein